MAVTMKQMPVIVATLGALSFIFGVIAENKKPASGTPIQGKGVIICKYPSDPTVALGYLSVALGYLSVAFLAVSTVAGCYSLFYPYKGKSIPQTALFQNKGFVVFFNVAVSTLTDPMVCTQSRELSKYNHGFARGLYEAFASLMCATTGLAATMLLWPTITEQLHHARNIHHHVEGGCPTAKTGLLGGGAFLSLDSCLFWLVALMFGDNARADYFEESDDKVAGSHATGEPIKGSA